MVLAHVHRFPNTPPPKKRNLPTRNRRGGAYVPARTSAQRRFHTKNTRIVHGDLTMDAPLQGDTGGHTGTAPTHLRYTFTHRGWKCIAHSRPHSLKQVVYANWHRDDALLF